MGFGEAVFDSVEAENALGWRAFRVKEEEKARVLSGKGAGEIAELRDGRKIYCVQAIPELSAEEACLLRNCLREYRDLPKGRKACAKEFFSNYCGERNIILGKGQRNYLEETLGRIVRPEGVLSAFLGDNSLEEIAVIGLGRGRPVFVFDRVFGWLETNVYFSDEGQIRNIVNAMAGTIGRRVTLQNPKLNAVLNDGSRLNACMEPASVSGPSVTIRKFRESPFTPSELACTGTVSFRQMAFMWMALQSDCSALICGNTGSGKTTLLNSLLNFVPKNERIVCVEETPELNVPQKHCVKLCTARELGIGMEELITNTLRMRPDRVVAGEVRDREEVCAFMNTVLAGQGKGCYATFHAQSAEECVSRLTALGARETDIASVDLVLVQKRWSAVRGNSVTEERKLTELCSVERGKEGICAKEISRFCAKKGRFEESKCLGNAANKMMRAFGISEKEIEKELKKREKFLMKLRGKAQGEFFAEISGYGKNG